MAKTNFIDGSPVTPAFLNAINNPTYSESPSENGEIPFPPAFSALSSRPRQFNLNSSCRGASQDGFSTWDFITYNLSTIGPRAESSAAGYYLNSDPAFTDMSGIVVANACGDPERGFWIWSVAGATPTAGKKLGIRLATDFCLSSGIYNKNASQFEDYDLTFQAEIKNDNTRAGVATFSAEIETSLESILVSEGRIEVLESSAPLVLAPGASGVIWKRIRVKANQIGTTTRAIVPIVNFELTTGGHFEFQLLGLGVFGGNTFGKKIPIDTDAATAKALRHSIGGLPKSQGFVLKQIVPGIWDNGNVRIYGYIRALLRNSVFISGTPVLSVAGASVWRRTSIIDAGPNFDVDVSADAIYTLEGIFANGREVLIRVSIPGGSYNPSTLASGEIYLVDFSGTIEVNPPA